MSAVSSMNSDFSDIRYSHVKFGTWDIRLPGACQQRRTQKVKHKIGMTVPTLSAVGFALKPTARPQVQPSRLTGPVKSAATPSGMCDRGRDPCEWRVAERRQ